MNLIASYTKKPVTIEAIQFADDADTISNIHGFLGADETVIDYANPAAPVLKIETLEGPMNAQVGDWIIKGVKGEFYPCKPDIFEATYGKEVGTPPDARTGHTFGYAVEALKRGHRVSREGWNGKGMFVVLMPRLQLPPYNTQGTERKVNDRTAKWIGEDQDLDCQPYLAMWNAQKQWQPGWNASQSDMLAEDWTILD